MALAVSLALCAMQGHAEEQLQIATADAVLPQVVVQGSSLSGATEGSNSYTKGAMSTATGLDLSVRDTPQSISIVTRQRIEDQAMMSVADALGGTIGISVKPVDRGRNQLSAASTLPISSSTASPWPPGISASKPATRRSTTALKWCAAPPACWVARAIRRRP
jgi:outer membrane receptor protein involved in Fe transport